MMQGKQAKIVSPTHERAIRGYLATTRYPARDRVMLLLSMKAGLRAKAMASLTWVMVTDAAGQVAEVLHVPNRASKGKTGGRHCLLDPLAGARGHAGVLGPATESQDQPHAQRRARLHLAARLLDRGEGVRQRHIVGMARGRLRLPDADLSVDHLLRSQVLEALACDQRVVVGRAENDLRHLSQRCQRRRQVAERPEASLPVVMAERRVGCAATRLRADGRWPYRTDKVEVQFHLWQPPQHLHPLVRWVTLLACMYCHHTMAPQRLVRCPSVFCKPLGPSQKV